MAVPNLRAVDATLPAPPYPADTKAKGWRFELDMVRIRNSDTWALTPPDLRGNLLLIWALSFEQIPSGSWPNNHDVIAGHIGMDNRIFSAHSDILLRGYRLHSDDRIYHPVVVERMRALLGHRESERKRKAAYRKAKLSEAQEMSHGTPTGHPRESHVSPMGVRTQEQEQEQEQEQDKEKTQEDRRPLAVDPPPPQPKKAEKPKKPRTPYQDILALYREMLPMCEQPLGVDHWTEARKATIRARWQKQMPDLDAWRECFGYVAASRFLTGRAKTSDGRKAFKAGLFWIAKEENLLKIYEGKYDD